MKKRAPWLPCLLAAFASAQAPGPELAPAPGAALVWEFHLQPLPRSERGLGALLAVPGVRETAFAWLQRQSATLGEATSGGEHPASPVALFVDRIDWSAVDRMTWAAETPGKGRHLVLVGYRDSAAAAAAKYYDDLSADLRERGLLGASSTPFPDARCVAVVGPGRAWTLGQRGSQIWFGDGLPLVLGPAAPRGGGAWLSADVPRVAFDAAGPGLAELVHELGYGDPTAVELRQNLEAAGYWLSFHLRTPRIGALPDAPALATAPRLPRFPGQFFVVRAGVDGPALVRWLGVAARRLGGSIDARVVEPLAGLVAGPCTIGLAEPATARVYPRTVLAVPVRSGQEALEGLSTQLPRLGLPVEAREVDGERWLIATIPGAPAALRPSCCVRDGVLWFAECPDTLRALRKLTAQGDDVFADPAATPCAAPAGAVAVAEAWFDCGAVWARGGASWGKAMYAALLPNVGPEWKVPPLVRSNDLPDPVEVAATLGAGRAVVYASAEGIGLDVAAPAIGPVLALAGGLLVPALPVAGGPLLEEQRVEAGARSTHARAQRLGEALQAYRAKEGRLPVALADLRPFLGKADAEPFVAPHAGERDLATLRRESFVLATPGTTAVDISGWYPGCDEVFDRFQSFDRTPRPVFARCRYPLRGRVVVVFADGTVAWPKEEDVREAVVPAK